MSEDICAAARKALGTNPVGNFRLGKLEDHVRQLPPEAGPLKRVLGRRIVDENYRRFEKLEDNAGAAQKKVKRTFKILGTLLVASSSVGILALVNPPDADAEAWSLPVVLALLYGLLAVALALAWRFSRAKPDEAWRMSRGAAEHLRRRHFELVMGLDEPVTGPEELPLLPLKLEYFRRYQLELQQEYHRCRGGEHFRRATWIRGMQWPCMIVAAVAVLAVLTGTAGAYSEQGSAVWLPAWLTRASGSLQAVEALQIDSWGIIIGLSLAIVYGAGFLYSRLDDNVRNAARYEIARDNLMFVGSELDEVRSKCGGPAFEPAVHGFVRRVHSIMAAELADWVRLRELEKGFDSAAGADAAAT